MKISNPSDTDLLVLDVDGVMTSGEVVMDSDGRLIYHFNVQDGSAIKYWIRHGGKIAIITGRESQAVENRAKNLGITMVYQRALHKIEAYEDCLKKSRVEAKNVCCLGDDLPDIPLLVNCGYPAAVENAVREVKQQAAYVTHSPGGRGAVREVIELLLRAKGLWNNIVDSYVEQKIELNGE